MLSYSTRRFFNSLRCACRDGWITGSVFINEETFHFAGTELSEDIRFKNNRKKYFLSMNIYIKIFYMTKRLTNVFKILSSIFYLLHDKIKLKKCALENFRNRNRCNPTKFSIFEYQFYSKNYIQSIIFLKKRRRS